jgi:hypothetical protein
MIRMTYYMAPEAAPATPAAAQPPATPPADPKSPPAAPAPVPPTVLTGDPAAPPPADPAKPAAPAAPEEIKVKFAEGVSFEQSRVEQFTKLAKEIGLKSEGAQKIADFYSEMVKGAAEEQVAITTKWAEEAKADKEVGGAAFDQNLAVAKKALDRVGSPALKELLARSGLGNHVEVIRLFAKIGKSISEDRLPGADPAAGGEPSLEQQLHEAYPNSPGMFKK